MNTIPMDKYFGFTILLFDLNKLLLMVDRNGLNS
jgi:hypothetical protein